jgi:hypothetical protein
MAETLIRKATVNVTRELETEARSNTELPQVPFGSLVRIALAVLAGYTVRDALRDHYLDPTSKRYAAIQEATRTATEADSDHTTNSQL